MTNYTYTHYCGACGDGYDDEDATVLEDGTIAHSVIRCPEAPDWDAYAVATFIRESLPEAQVSVDMSGGGCLTIYVIPPTPNPDPDEEHPGAVLLGPGYYRSGTLDRRDCYVGGAITTCAPDPDHAILDPEWDERAVANVAVNFYHRLNA